MSSEHDAQTLLEELEQFKKEKEQIKNLIGSIGGTAESRLDKISHILFVSALIALFGLDLAHYLLGWEIPFSTLFSVELGLLLVSVKIIWMIHKQTKVFHFQFWILNSIEYRLNEIAKGLKEAEKQTP